MLASDLVDLLGPIQGDECSDEIAFRRWRDLVEDFGWVGDEIERLCGFLRIAPVTYFLARRFDVEARGEISELSVIIGVLDVGERLVDAVAWPLEQPDRWATYGRGWPVLGLKQLLEHPVNAAAASLRVLRTPLSWLLAGGEGIVPLDLPAAAKEICAALEAGGRIRLEDDAHAAEVAAYMPPATDFRLVVVDDAREAA